MPITSRTKAACGPSPARAAAPARFGPAPRRAAAAPDQEVALVLERQEAGRDAHEAADAGGDEQQRRRRRQGTACRAAAPAAAPYAARDRAEAALEQAERPGRAMPGARRAQPGGALHRLQRGRVHRADRRRRRDHQRELRVEPPRQARQEGGRHEHRHQHEGDADDRAEQLVERGRRRLHPLQAAARWIGGALDHDDRVVHDDADRQHDREQGGEVDAEAERSPSPRRRR